MRADSRFDPDEYFEDPQDRRSHIRAQLVSETFSLLNLDVAGLGEPSPEAWEFIKVRRYGTTSEAELSELDRLADRVAGDPEVTELVSFYRRSPTLRFEAAERYAFCCLSAQTP